MTHEIWRREKVRAGENTEHPLQGPHPIGKIQPYISFRRWFERFSKFLISRRSLLFLVKLFRGQFNPEFYPEISKRLNDRLGNLRWSAFEKEGAVIVEFPRILCAQCQTTLRSVRTQKHSLSSWASNTRNIIRTLSIKDQKLDQNREAGI